MMKWVLLACLASMAGAVSPVAPAPELEGIPLDISKYAIFLSESKAEETTTFTLKQTVITITKHAAAESSSLAVSNKKRLPKLIVKDAAAKGLVCVAAGQVEVTSAGQVVEAGESSASAAAAAAGAAAEEGGKAEELILVGQGDGVVASVSAAASAAAGSGAASSAASGGGAASSAAAGGGGAASSAAGGGGAASSAAAGDGSAASSAAGDGSAASSAAGDGSAASSAAGDGAASSSAAGDGAASSSAAGEGAAASSATGDSTSSSSVGAGGEVDVEVSGGGEAAGYSEGQGVHISGSGEVTHIDERFCTCVPGYLCDEDGYINTSGAGQIDIRTFTKTAKKRAFVSKCTDQETCCKHRDNEQIGWTPSDCGDRSPIPLDRRIVGGEVSKTQGDLGWSTHRNRDTTVGVLAGEVHSIGMFRNEWALGKQSRLLLLGCCCHMCVVHHRPPSIDSLQALSVRLRPVKRSSHDVAVTPPLLHMQLNQMCVTFHAVGSATNTNPQH